MNSKSGGDGPKLNDLLQVRERHLLQDRIELLGPVRHRDVRDVSSPPHAVLSILIPISNAIAVAAFRC